MQREFLDGVVANGSADFFCVVNALRRRGAGWCVVGGWAVNTYAPSVYTAEVDLVVTAAELGAMLEELRAADFRVSEFSLSVDVRRLAETGRNVHRLTVHFLKPLCYQSFVARASARPLFGIDVPVAALADVVQGKRWALEEPARRASKYFEDKFDLLRLAEACFDEVAPLLPDELRTAAEADRTRRLEGGEGGWGTGMKRERHAVARTASNSSQRA